MVAILQDLDECVSLIEATLADSHGAAEYALYIQALIHRQRGAECAVHIFRLLGSLPTIIKHIQNFLKSYRPALRVPAAVSAGSCCQPKQPYLP